MAFPLHEWLPKLRKMKYSLSHERETEKKSLNARRDSNSWPRQEYNRDSVQNVFRDPDRYAYYQPPAASRTTQLPNCKQKGESCTPGGGPECCFCTTEGGFYDCMICSSTDKKCFI